MSGYKLSHITGHPDRVFTNRYEAGQIVRLMIASNALVASHRYIEVVERNPFSEGDLTEFSGEYLNSALRQISGILSEALDTVRCLRDWFPKFERQWSRMVDDHGVRFACRGELCVVNRVNLVDYSSQASDEYKTIKYMRDKIGFHWSQNDLEKEIERLGRSEIKIARLVETSRGSIVHYDIADHIISKVGFTDDPGEMKKRVLCVLKVVGEFLVVSSTYLPSFLALSGCNRVPEK